MKHEIKIGNSLEVLKTIDEKSIDCVVTSPPYWGLRDYGKEGQLGDENSPEEFVDNVVSIFREIWRVIKDEGTVWLNLGDSYYNYRPGDGQSLIKQSIASNSQDLPVQCSRRANKIEGLKEKSLVGIPWRVALALQKDGWILRQDIIWHKPNPMPESVKDRCTKNHEYIFLLTKNRNYYYDHEAIQEYTVDGNERRNKRSVWTVNVKAYKGAHFATYPTELIKPCILAGSPEEGTVLDPFSGSGTTGGVALNNKRNYIGIELNPDYAKISENRINDEVTSTLEDILH